jgi:hypothetical protein
VIPSVTGVPSLPPYSAQGAKLRKELEVSRLKNGTRVVSTAAIELGTGIVVSLLEMELERIGDEIQNIGRNMIEDRVLARSRPKRN